MKLFTNHLLNRIIRGINRRLNLIVKKLESFVNDDSIFFEGEKKLVNIGGGNFDHEKWINLDYSTNWYNKLPKNHLSYDLTSGNEWPLEPNSISCYYTSHVIEHLPYDNVRLCFENLYKSLKPGGLLRVTCPDASLIYDAVKRNDRSFFADQIHYYSEPVNFKHQYKNSLQKANILELLVDVIATQKCNLRKDSINPIESSLLKDKFNSLNKNSFLDWLTKGLNFSGDRAGEHITWWDHDKLSNLLNEIGFKNIVKSGYLQSKAGEMRIPELFDSRHPHKSLYIECEK